MSSMNYLQARKSNDYEAEMQKYFTPNFYLIKFTREAPSNTALEPTAKKRSVKVKGYLLRLN
jgi:serine kinase of HPr protein (carbohydrate metabolism regulator)